MTAKKYDGWSDTEATCYVGNVFSHSNCEGGSITAGELIRYLADFPPNTEVFLMDEDGEKQPIQYAELREYPLA